MKKKKRIAVLVAIALAVPGVGNWDRQAADAMTADTAQSSVADIIKYTRKIRRAIFPIRCRMIQAIRYLGIHRLLRLRINAPWHFQRAMIRVEQSRKRQFAISRIQVPVGRLEH